VKVLVLEDERPALDQLLAGLRAWDPGAQVEVLDSVRAAVRRLLEGEPDVILADIRLTDGRSLEVFERVRVRCPVVFVTAYDQYTQPALALGGIDYITKPVDPARLAQALDKVLRLAAHFRGGAPGARSARQRLLVRRGSATLAVPVDSIAWFHTEHRLVFATCADGARHVVDQSLQALEDTLDPERFFRVGRSFIVQIEAVRGFVPHGKGRLLLNLEPAGGAVVSADRAAAFRAWLDR